MWVWDLSLISSVTLGVLLILVKFNFPQLEKNYNTYLQHFLMFLEKKWNKAPSTEESKLKAPKLYIFGDISEFKWIHTAIYIHSCLAASNFYVGPLLIFHSVPKFYLWAFANTLRMLREGWQCWHHLMCVRYLMSSSMFGTPCHVPQNTLVLWGSKLLST